MTGNIEETRAILQAAGGTAFPLSVVLTTDARTGAPTSQENWPGMTLRDYFAGQFLAGAAATANEPLDVKDAADQFDVDNALREYWDHAARTAYIAADAMIAARKGGA